MYDEQDSRLSVLSQRVTHGALSVCIEIVDDGEGGWLLEIIDDFDNATVWNGSFPDAQDALETGLRAIEEEGIEAFIGPNLHALH
ncbi:MAG: hypothetical protein H6977_10845 [Gammaproteobacteria bacterium]|nr:hypothetical protein [Gammaproteobacteria bacterium]MCP5200500.1 hypothetical protein [Gammaproteobacteria bacterium]